MQAEGQHVNQLTFTNNTVTNFNRAGDNNNRLLNLRNATVGTVLWSGNTITNPRQYSADSLIDFGVSGAGAPSAPSPSPTTSSPTSRWPVRR